MFTIGPVAFTFTLGFWVAIICWAYFAWTMPKRGLAALVLGFFVAIWYMGLEHKDPLEYEYFQVGVWFAFSWLFTCMMCPIMMVAFFLGYKVAR